MVLKVVCQYNSQGSQLGQICLLRIEGRVGNFFCEERRVPTYLRRVSLPGFFCVTCLVMILYSLIITNHHYLHNNLGTVQDCSDTGCEEDAHLQVVLSSLTILS